MKHGALLLLYLALSLAPAGARVDSPRTELGHGYAMLHEALSQFRHLDLAVWLKHEDASVTRLLESLAETAEAHRRTLEELASASPTIDLDNQGLTRFELEKRRALIVHRGLQLGTPLIGETGPRMERQTLLSLAAAINQQRFLIQVMREEEPIAARRDWLDGLKADLDRLHGEYEALLAKRYFAAPAD